VIKDRHLIFVITVSTDKSLHCLPWVRQLLRALFVSFYLPTPSSVFFNAYSEQSTFIMLLSLIALPFLLAMANVQGVGARGRICPLPLCDECIPRYMIYAPGIGFDLTTSYATSAIRNHNGSIDSVAKVEAGSEY